MHLEVGPLLIALFTYVTRVRPMNVCCAVSSAVDVSTDDGLTSLLVGVDSR